MASLYANENFPLQVVEALRSLGHDVLTSQEAGNANQAVPDNEVLAYASENQRILLTLNKRDFINLHKQNDRHAGIIICTQDPDIHRQAERIHQVILTHGSLASQLIRVNRPG
jgi:predicted nuclease of predicted toxin-antitoxin system